MANQMAILRKVLRRIRRYWVGLVVSLLLATLYVVMSLYIPILVGNAIDCIVDAGRVDFFSPAAQQQIEKHCADAVDRKPRPVEEAAVGKGFVPIQKDGNLPEKTADRAEKEEINLLGEEKRYRSLLRCAEFGKIRKTVMFFHGHSITGTFKIIEL